MKRIIYGLILLCSILSVVACSAEANGESEPANDSTTLDGWYVETFNCCGKKLNYELMKIDGEEEYYYWTKFEYSNSEINVTYNYLVYPITIDGNTFNDGYEWEMTTDKNGTWMTTDGSYTCAPYQKVSSPEKLGNGIGTIDFYTKDNIMCGIMYRNNEYYFMYWDDNYQEEVLTKKDENTFDFLSMTYSSTVITVSNSEITIESPQELPVPEGTYTRYVRNTPWPTVSAE